MVMIPPLLSRWLLATRYLKAQKSLHNILYNPWGLCFLLILFLKTSLGMDALFYSMMLLILPPDLIAEAKETMA